MSTTKKYKLTDQDRAQLPAWRDKWIANAMSTTAMDESEREICRAAVARLYRAANLPPPQHIVFVASPFVLRFAGGLAAAIWHLRDAVTRAATAGATDDVTRVATDGATAAATHTATAAATYAATDDATAAATAVATYTATAAATYAATYAATDAVTRAATDAVTRAATAAVTRAATDDAAAPANAYAAAGATADADATATATATAAATDEWWYHPYDLAATSVRLLGARHVRLGIQCARAAYRMWQGGNQWSGWDSFLTFFRDVVRLPIDYSRYDAWVVLAQHSGPRIVHPKFCMISDRPARLLVDTQNRPHCEDGPFCRWRDGSALYALHGAHVPAWFVEHPERITAQLVIDQSNAEIRRIMIDHMGLERFAHDADLRPIQSDDCGELYRMNDGTTFVRVTNATPNPDGTRKVYYLAADPDVKTATQAVADSFGLDESTYRALREKGMVET